ncbi:MAG: agmatine deiminase family protein [Phycisphaerales bacterium]
MFHLCGLFLILLAATATAQTGEGLLLTTVPPQPVRIPAEFEPMQAVIVDWRMIESGDIYKCIAEDVKLILPYDSDGRYKEMQTLLPTYGVNMDNCEFYSVKMMGTPRDFLPWFMFINRSQPAFIHNDGTVPEYFWEQGYPIYDSGLPVQGGDFMTDGQGTAISFPWIVDLYAMLYEGTDYPLMDRVLDYWGIHTYHIISNPEIKGVTIPPHIDCLAKFLSPDTILVLRYPSSNPLCERTEAAAAYFGRQISCYGTPYKVLRLDVQDEEPYINSLIVNRRVLVPIVGEDTDDGALAIYRNAMPGYEVIGITNAHKDRSLWEPFYALHCDTMGIADEQMLYIHHIPLLDRPPAAEGFPIRAEIEAYSGTEFVDGTPIVLWRTEPDANESTASWNTAAMAQDTESGDHRYLACIPAQPVGTVIQYYLEAKDASGRDETHPYIGPAQAHTFTVTTLGANVSAVSAKKGGTVELYINTGANHAQQGYRLAYSVIADANATEVLPETTVLTGFEGTLDDLGIGAARLTFPEPLASEWVGRSLRFSLELDDQRSAVPDTVSIRVLE